MLITKLSPRILSRFNLVAGERCLHTNFVSRQSEVQQRGDLLPKKNEENVPTIIKRDPVPQKLLKRIKVEYHGIERERFNDETIWLPIYRLPRIGRFRAFIRFKVYLSFLSVAACTRSVVKLLTVLEPSLLAPALLTSFTTVGLYLTGTLFRKLIVQIYATEDLEYVRFCRFTFFGNRLDMVLPLSAVVPLSDTNPSRRKLFMILETKKPENISLDYDFHEFYEEKFNIVLRYGGVLDLRRFEKIFGTILHMKIGSG